MINFIYFPTFQIPTIMVLFIRKIKYFQRGATIMKILFYDTKSYDREFFEKLLPSYPGIEIKFIEISMRKLQLLPTATTLSVHL